MRLLDVQLSLPFMLLALSIIGVLGPSLTNIVVVLAITGWVVYARVVRSEILSLRTQEFVGACTGMRMFASPSGGHAAPPARMAC